MTEMNLLVAAFAVQLVNRPQLELGLFASALQALAGALVPGEYLVKLTYTRREDWGGKAIRRRCCWEEP